MVGRRDLLKRGGGALAAVGIGTGLNGDAALGKEIDGPGRGDPKHIALIVLDRSGSMAGLKLAVTKGVNDYLDEQADKAGMFIGLVQFDSYKTKDDCYCEPIFGFTTAQTTPRLGPNDYQPRGGTPLLAAIAEAISKLEQVIRPTDRALLVVQTDGHELNSPPEITKAVVKQLIAAKEAEGNWTFAFMGADIDAWDEGGSLGMNRGSTLGYANTASGTNVAYRNLSAGTANWYESTGGGGTRSVMAAAPTNTNANFFETPAIIPIDLTTLNPPGYTGKIPWETLNPMQKGKWIRKNQKKNDPPTA